MAETFSMYRRRGLYCAPLIAVLWLSLIGLGCGSKIKNKKPTYPVTGKVLVQSQPAEGALLIFRPPESKDSPEEWTMGFPRAKVKADGTFAVETYGNEDGAPAGDYIVLANWQPAAEGEISAEEAEASDRLGGYYMDPALTPLRAKVEAKANQLPTIELTTGLTRPVQPEN
jgi:hypothetical protein